MNTKSTRSKRGDILNIALSVMARNPGASLLDVAEEARVGRATIYRHFPSREVLIRELALAAFEDMKAAVQPVYEKKLGGKASLEQIIHQLVPLGDRFHFLWNEVSIYDSEDIKQSYMDLLDKLQALVKDAKKEGAIASDVPDAWVSAALDSLIWAAWLTVEEGYLARREAPGLVIRSFFNGVGPTNQ